MSQSPEINTGTVENLEIEDLDSIEEKDYSWDTYFMDVSGPLDLEAAEAYVQQNPGTRIVLDYSSPVISRGWGETDTDMEHVHRRQLGGATTYEGPNSAGMLQSGGCFEDFQGMLEAEVDELVPEEVYLGGKDIYADQGLGRNDAKLIGFGGRMDGADSPNIYGASWRERSLTDETREMIENDTTAALPEEVEQLSYNIEEETGQNFTFHLADSNEAVELEELPLEDLGRDLPERSSNRLPTSCTVFWRPENGYNFHPDKVETAVWPWETS